jgi:hypothetical protein
MKKLKLLATVLLSLILLAGLFACGGGDGGSKPGDEMTQNIKRAAELAENVKDKFWVSLGEGDNYFREYYPTLGGEVSKAYLWSHFAALGMQYHLCKLFPENQAYRDSYREMLDALKYYKDRFSNDTLVKYHSGRGIYPNFGTGDVFFDDNIWVARNFLFAYDVFGEDFYLEEAKRVVNYIYTGWNEEIGGLVWNERGLTDQGTAQELERGLSANACSIIVNAWLYQITGEESYLTWAEKFYQFCKRVQDPETYIYYNGIHTVIQDGKRLDGSVNTALYSYNPGSMIIADLFMYEITEEEEYLTDAFRAAGAAYDAFIMLDLGKNVKYYNDFVWFTAILMESYYALYSYGPDKVQPYIDVFQESIDYAYENYKNEHGLLPHNYAAGFAQNNSNDRSLLTQSGTAEIYVLLALCEKAAA